MAIYHCHLWPIIIAIVIATMAILVASYGHYHCHYDHLYLPCMAISIPLLLQVWQLLLPFIASIIAIIMASMAIIIGIHGHWHCHYCHYYCH